MTTDPRARAVWVIEILVLDADGKPWRWEPWHAELTRADARRYEMRTRMRGVRRRIVKYTAHVKAKR